MDVTWVLMEGLFVCSKNVDIAEAALTLLKGDLQAQSHVDGPNRFTLPAAKSAQTFQCSAQWLDRERQEAGIDGAKCHKYEA